MIKHASGDQNAGWELILVQHWFEELERLDPTENRNEGNPSELCHRPSPVDYSTSSMNASWPGAFDKGSSRVSSGADRASASAM